ncbi:hypothetical protein Tco_0788802 [Tanacetum coccineum]
MDHHSTSPTPLIDKIGKFEDLLTSGQTILVDEAGNPLKKVEFSGDYDSEDEVASVDNDMAAFIASQKWLVLATQKFAGTIERIRYGKTSSLTLIPKLHLLVRVPMPVDVKVRGVRQIVWYVLSMIKATPEIVEKMMKKITAMNVVRVLKVVTSADERSSWIAAAVAMVNGRKRKESVMKWSEFVLQIMSA